MTPIQQLQLRASEIRSRLSAIGSMAELDAETRSEMDTLGAEYADNEARQRALMVAGDAPKEPIETRNDSEGREYRELLSGASFGRYVAAAMANTGISAGAEAELNQHMGIAENYFPLRLLADRQVEERAAINGDAGTAQGTWLDRVFHGTAAEMVGVSFRPVAPGISSYPVTTSGGSPAQRGRTEDTATSTYGVAVTEIKPARRAVHGVYSNRG